MAMEKSMAIVVRLVEFSETSLVVTLYTRDFGKIGALAKGARRPKNPFDFALDLLAVCRVVFLRKSSASLDLLTEAKLERRFRSASRDLASWYAGCYLAEVLAAFTDYGDPCPALFDAANTTLQALDDGRDILSWTAWFEWALLQHTGHLPMLEACAVCGRSLPDSKTTVFGMRAAGLLCPACRLGQRPQVRLRQESIDWLKRLTSAVREPASAPEFLEQHPVPGEAHAVLSSFLAYQLGRPLRTASLLPRPRSVASSSAPRSAS